MNILIPMAGAGSRFEKAGYNVPKPLIKINNKPMIQMLTENLNQLFPSLINFQYIYVCQKKHFLEYDLKNFLNSIAPNCKIITVNRVTEGAVCTTLLAKTLINNSSPLLLVNSDQIIEWDNNDFLYNCNNPDIDGAIPTFNVVNNKKWSYAKIDSNGFITEVAEKNPISNNATAGIYYWKHGSDYVKYAEQMIAKNIRVNNEFYICPVYNEAIQDGKKIKIFYVDKVWELGTPEGLVFFLKEHL